MPTAEAAAVLESIDVGTGERAVQRVLDVDLENTLRRAQELFGKPIRLHDGSMLFIQTHSVEAPADGTRITVHGPDKVTIEGIRFAVDKVHHFRTIGDGFL